MCFVDKEFQGNVIKVSIAERRQPAGGFLGRGGGGGGRGGDRGGGRGGKHLIWLLSVQYY
jgi:hypothetical protein